MSASDPRLPSPASEILDYLARHPDAQDTIDGIIHWWIPDARIRNAAEKIANSVAQLVERGFLSQKPAADGQILYSASPRYLSILQQSRSQTSSPQTE
jgi:hypothetical protein